MMNNYVKSPINYTGSKFKQLPQIMPYFPDKISMMVDLFGGGFNVGVNCEADHIIYNDKLTLLVELMECFNNNSYEDIVSYVNNQIDKFQLEYLNKETYTHFRDYYNSGKGNVLDFYILTCYSFNNQIRFNKKGGFNMPVGKNYFSPKQKNNLKEFLEVLHKKNVSFINKDFRSLDYDILDFDSFVYCDPPYLVTTAPYNESSGWNREDEENLLSLLSELNDRGIKFALSNMLSQGDKDNDLLINWLIEKGFNCIAVQSKHPQYHKKSTNMEHEHVLIINY